MEISRCEATVEDGRTEFSEPMRLPESAKVALVVTGVEEAPRFHVASPRLARPEQAADFVKDVSPESRDAGR